MKTYTPEEIKDIIEKHQHWLKEDCDGWENMHADLSGAVLRHAVLSGAVLRHADLRHADLRHADLRHADLSGADLRHADLSGAVLRHADLSGADLRHADLSGAVLSGAVLSGDENLDSVKYSVQTAFFAIGCPEKGAFTAFKKCGNHIVELEVCADAKRSSATSRKCRVSKAKVVEITNIDGTPADITTVASDYDRNFKYTVGEIVEEPKFEENRWIECAPGIHCFITRQEAVIYDA